MIFTIYNDSLVVNRGGWKVFPETENVDGQRKPKVEEVPHTRPSGPSALDLHALNFVEAVTANDPICSNVPFRPVQ